MYYILERIIESGRPPFINAMLHEQFHENGANQPMEYAWNFAVPPNELDKLPPRLFLISKDRDYHFDFVSSFNGHIVSDKFLDAMKKFDLNKWEISELTVVNQKGNSISQKKYFFIRLPRKCWEKEIIDEENSIYEKRKNGEIKKITKLTILDKPLPDIFVSNEISLLNFVFFSDHFINAIKNESWCGFRISLCMNAGVIKPT